VRNTLFVKLEARQIGVIFGIRTPPGGEAEPQGILWKIWPDPDSRP